MKSENKRFGRILFDLNSKVNRRSSYLHDISTKYNSGGFSHGAVLSNIKHEPCLQTPRSYIHVESLKNSPKCTQSTKRQRRSIDEGIFLQATLAKFYIKGKERTPLQTIRVSKRTIFASHYSNLRDATYNTD